MATITFPAPSTISPNCPTVPDGAKAITPSDADVFAQGVFIYVGTGGTLAVTPANLQADVSVTVADGAILPFRVVAVKATGTTATGILAVY